MKSVNCFFYLHVAEREKLLCKIKFEGTFASGNFRRFIAKNSLDWELVRGDVNGLNCN